jgi:hypothetical protein
MILTLEGDTYKQKINLTTIIREQLKICKGVMMYTMFHKLSFLLTDYEKL